MISLIIFLALGWLLYRALFPKVAPYYGKDLPDDIPRLGHRSPGLYEDYDFISSDPLHDPFLWYWGNFHEPEGCLALERRYDIEDPWEAESGFEHSQPMMFEDPFGGDDIFQLDDHYHHHDICTGENDLSTGFADW